MFGVDYAWGRPGVPALERAGVKFAARYLSHDTSGKNLTHVEAQQLSDAGMWITVVWESTANRPLGGRTAGVNDATDAARLAEQCGMPAGRPIYFAADWAATPAQQVAINAYLDGAASVLGRARVGLYGGYGVISRAFDAGKIAYGWQTYAWSGGAWDHRAQLHQYSNDHIIGGVGLDYDVSMTGDYGQWRIGVSPAPAPAPQPQLQEDDMPAGQLAEGAKAITPISLPRGRYKTIGFICDNTLQGLPAAQLRVAVHHHGPNGGNWGVTTVAVDSTQGQAVVTFALQAETDGISVRREDAGDVHVAYEVS